MMCVRHGWQPYCYQRTPGGGRSRLFITGMTEGGVLDPWPQSKLDYHCQVKNTLERMMAQTDPTVHNMAVALAVAVDRMVKAYDDEQDGLYHRATQGMHTDLVNILREKLEAAEQDERNSEEYLTGFADALSLAEDPYDEPDMADAGGY